jgi:ribosome-binding factor A
MPRPQPTRRYPRKLRINELLREIIAEALERVDDDRLALVAITGVDADADLRRATVWFDVLDTERDSEVIEALEELRPSLQRAVSRQTTTKHVPVLSFAPDEAIRIAERIEAVLRADAPVIANRPPEPEVELEDPDDGEA